MIKLNYDQIDISFDIISLSRYAHISSSQLILSRQTKTHVFLDSITPFFPRECVMRQMNEEDGQICNLEIV